MPTKPKPATVKPSAPKPEPATVKPSAPKPEPSLYKAIRAILEAKDRETLHARTTKAVEAVEALLEGSQPVEYRTIQNQEPSVPWSLDGLVVDPGEEAVGQWGWFWDNAAYLAFGKLDSKDFSDCPYDIGCDWFKHFSYIPNFPGAELLERATGYETAK